MQPTEVQATPEEEAMLQQATDVALEIIHGEGVTGDEIAKMVLSAADVIQGLGQATATTVLAVEQKMQLSDDVKLELAYEVMAELADLAIQAGALGQDELTAETVEKAVQYALAQYIELQEATGQLDPAALQASVQDAQQIAGAEYGG
jgi:hypothetical protein